MSTLTNIGEGIVLILAIMVQYLLLFSEFLVD